jgi:transposase-like protein
MESFFPLFEVVLFFGDESRSVATLMSLRWPEGVRCVHCGATQPLWSPKRQSWQCRICQKQFGIKTGTVFENTTLSLGNWLIALWMFVESEGRVGSWELQRTIAVKREVAVHMLKLLRIETDASSWKLMLERMTAAMNAQGQKPRAS